MESIGNEVGQKMRSAVKAKLMELGCYVDDELPDYIMVMVANKRTRSQMESDLNLFLGDNTTEFVNWIQQVLKKLREVRLTNPELYACSSFGELKRKASMEMVECVIKKEKRLKMEKNDSATPRKLLSDDIPVNANKLVEKRVVKQRTESEKETSSLEDSFDIPSISEVNLLVDSQLDAVTNKIKEARRILMKSDSEDEDFINMNTDADEEMMTSGLFDSTDANKLSNNRKITMDAKNEKKTKTLGDLRQNLINRRKSPTSTTVIVNKGSNDKDNNTELNAKKRTISLTEMLREEQEISGKIFKKALTDSETSKKERDKTQNKTDKPDKKAEKRKSVHSRLGVSSTVIKPKKTETQTDQNKNVDNSLKVVPSVVKVKPRRQAAGFLAANKKLLLKAVADAQRSVAQTPISGPEALKTKPLYTKKYKEKLAQAENAGSKTIVIQVPTDDDDVKKVEEDNPEENSSEYVSVPTKRPVQERLGELQYMPPNIETDLNNEEDFTLYFESDEEENISNSNNESVENQQSKPKPTHQFIVTLDGLKNSPFTTKQPSPTTTTTIVDEPKSQKRPSPIIFDKNIEPPQPKKESIRNVPETLPKISIPTSLKSKERCKFWPSCKLGDSCEYIHPGTSCKMFPMCKFGERCLYIHPKCKFFTSCARKDCPYNHGPIITSTKVINKSLTYKAAKLPLSNETCKYFPNCINPKCNYFHPPSSLKPCKFGFACLNKLECAFSHSIPSKEKLTWHSVSK